MRSKVSDKYSLQYFNGEIKLFSSDFKFIPI